VNYIISEFKKNLPDTVEELGGQAKDLKKFNDSIDKLNKSNSPDAYGFIDYICSKEMTAHINSLKQKATKKKPFSFERLSFVILPLFKFFESRVGNKGEMEKINKSISQWFGIVQNHPNINLSTKFDAMLHLYLALGTETSLKSIIFLQMVHFLVAHKQLAEVMIQPVRDIHNVSADWYLQKDERIDLYVQCAQALDKQNDSTGAFQVYYQAFKLINTLGAKETKKWTSEAESLVMTALKSPECINLEEIMLLDAVKDLSSTSKEIFSLVDAVTTKDMKQFNASVEKHKKLMQAHEVTQEMLTTKKRFILICSMDLDSSTGKTMSFKELGQLLSLAEDDIEEWAITAINNDIIDARIDQLKEQIIIKTHKLR
jgi:hypothetical protein